MQSIRSILERRHIEASAPCRIDMGGTLDISTFYYPLRHLSPCTFNIAVNLRTRVRLFPYKQGIVKISSSGFKSAEYPLDKAPFNHPLGLMFAIAAYFRAEGVCIDIDSSSPPCSALGGSSAAAVALIGAFSRLGQTQTLNPMPRQKIALLAHALEESVAGVPCGLQDQLAAVYGGVNAWYWPATINGPSFRKKTIVKKPFHKNLNKHLLLAYCGIPHESKNINTRWVEQFISGKYRKLWAEIIVCTQRFSDALFEPQKRAYSPLLAAGLASESKNSKLPYGRRFPAACGGELQKNFKEACASMNRETAIRRRMTPDVLDKKGAKLVDLAVKNRCGARFTGAGGGGCIWAIGEIDDIDRLKHIWEKALLSRKEACLLNVDIDSKGLEVNQGLRD